MSKNNTYAFIDASNLFYGGEKSLGWKIDYKKLLKYLKDKYEVSQVFYFGGVEIHKFDYDYLKSETVSLEALEKYLLKYVKDNEKALTDIELLVLNRHLQKIHFYLKLEKFGFDLHLKPVKIYKQNDGTTEKKANCDVDMAFHLMKEKDNFGRIVVLSGDGDFLPALKYMKEIGKEVFVLARGGRTAKEIRQFAGANFRDFEYLKFLLEMKA